MITIIVATKTACVGIQYRSHATTPSSSVPIHWGTAFMKSLTDWNNLIRIQGNIEREDGHQLGLYPPPPRKLGRPERWPLLLGHRGAQ